MGNSYPNNCNCFDLDWIKLPTTQENLLKVDLVECYSIQKVIRIQSYTRMYLTKRKISLLKQKLKSQTPKLEPTPTINPFDLELCPGKIINAENVLIKSKVAETEKEIGLFQIEEKELLIYIEQYQTILKRYDIEYPDKKIYLGYYSPNWDREAYGILILEDGSKYEGMFRQNKMCGRGRLINTHGDYYEGEFDSDMANGFGKFVSKEGGIYIGYWKNDKQDGKGEEIFSDGSRYEGSYLRGLKHEKGKFAWSDGSVYEGDFCKNIIEGHGIYRWRDGRVYQGEWRNNKMEGVGIFIWTDKKKYIGEYLNDNKHGYGVFIWPRGKKYEGQWSNGKQNGFGFLIIGNQRTLGIWKAGQKVTWIKEEEYQEKISKIELGIKGVFERINSFNYIKSDFSSALSESLSSM